MPYPLRFVKEIHARLMVRYGSAWATKWAGIDQAALEADWADVLDGMPTDAVKAALANLPPEFPPTAAMFRKLGEQHANSMPDARELLRLRDERGGTKPSPEVLARLKAIAGMSVRNVTHELSGDD
jgi:hypothetical protein